MVRRMVDLERNSPASTPGGANNHQWEADTTFEIGLINRINLKILTTFLFVYMLNVILYFSWTFPDFQPNQR